MIECPDYLANESHSVFNIILDAVFLLNVFLNLYVIYCIIFRSTKQMTRYKWYLLWHQVIAFLSDFVLGYLTKPLIFVPFPIFYPLGALSGKMSSANVTPACALLLGLSVAAAVHLFCFRYNAVLGKRYFPRKWSAVMAYLYVIGCTPFVGACIGAYTSDQEAVFREYAAKYTCITADLRKIPGFFAYPIEKVIWFIIIPALFALSNAILLTVYFIWASMRVLSRAPHSDRMAHLQKKFLFQLILQAAVPLIIVVIPLLGLLFAVMFSFFGITPLGMLIVCIGSFFSASSAIVLIFMNPTYHSLVSVPIKKMYSFASRSFDSHVQIFCLLTRFSFMIVAIPSSHFPDMIRRKSQTTHVPVELSKLN